MPARASPTRPSAAAKKAALKKAAVVHPPFEGFPQQGVDWFRALALSQSREWFQANRQGYETLWLQPMQSLLAELKAPLAKLYGRPLGAPKVFRLNRDVRFSKDKSPYKTNVSGVLGFEGAGGPMGGPVALYLHLGLDEAAAAGFYALEPDGIQRLRRRVLDDKTGKPLAKLLDAAQRKGVTLTSMETLKRAPPGVPVDHPRIEILKHKGLGLSLGSIPTRVRYSKALKGWLLEQLAAAQPVVAWGLAQRL
jgi:uncharacterized protein (TIGR02453 family)